MKSLFVILILIFHSGSAFAHTEIIATIPASGSIIKSAPDTISLTFADNVKLTKVIVINGSKTKTLSFTPRQKAKSYKIAASGLSVGRNEIQWRALAEDGHILQGKILIVVRP
jgi:methionine-rich copper-binding protein CopC